MHRHESIPMKKAIRNAYFIIRFSIDETVNILSPNSKTIHMLDHPITVVLNVLNIWKDTGLKV